jgi:hypothetical protein
MPPDRDVEFTIELRPDMTPISRRPYNMTPKELVQLKIQLKEFKGSSIQVLHLGVV